jgi:hypothetical protein
MSLETLPVAMFDIIRRMGCEAVTAKEIGVEGNVMVSLVNRGFLLADKDGEPTIYRLSAMGHGAHAVLTAPVNPRAYVGPVTRIQQVVANYYSIPMCEMVSARRPRAVARPRQIAMYLARELTPMSLPEIGRRFGGRDHTTVMHAIRVIEGLYDIDFHGIATEIDALRATLSEDEKMAA